MARPRPSHVPVHRGDEVTLDVERFADGPDGLGKIGDYVVFVPGVLPGERALVEITSAARKYGRGELIEVRRSSRDRVEPRCAHFLRCGGCHLQHVAYPVQLAHKRERLERALSYALRDDPPEIADTVAAAQPYGQRHKVVVHLANDERRGLVAAFHESRSPDFVHVHECPASAPRAWSLASRGVELLRTLRHRAWHPHLQNDGLLRSVLVRLTTTGQAHLVIVAQAPRIIGLERIVDGLHAAGATTISVNHNQNEMARLLGPDTVVVSGPGQILERIGDLAYPISPTSFFQTSPHMAAQLVQHVVAWLQPTQRDEVADLYCGGGLLTLPLARRARHVLGIELNGSAIADARAAAAENRIQNVTWRSGHVDAWLAAARNDGSPRPDLIALDPPRSGLTPEVVTALQRLAARRLAYVSCEPAALQRDLPALAEAGYRTVRVVPFDMFPQTAHIESLACLARID